MPAVAVLLVGVVLAMAWVLATSGIMRQIADSLAQILPPLPIITWQDVFAKVGSWFSGLGSFVNAHIVPLWQGAFAHWDGHYQMLNAHSKLAGSTFGAIARTKNLYIPHAVGSERADRIAALTDQWDATVGLAESVQVNAAGYVGAERADRIAAETALWDSDVGLAEQVQATALGAVGQERADRIAAEQVLWAWAVGLDEQVQATALSAVGSERADRIAAEADLGAAILQGDQTTIKLLEGELASTAGGLLQLINANALSAAGATTLVSQAVQTIENSDCMKFCNILGGLGALLQGAELAGLLALLAQAYADPGGAVEVINQDLVGPAEGLWNDAIALFGIKGAA